MAANFIDGLAQVHKDTLAHTPAVQPRASNTGPLDAWRRATTPATNTGPADITPFHPRAPGAPTAADAWQAAMRQAKANE